MPLLRKLIVFGCCLPSLSLLLCSITAGQAPQPLRYQFKKGDQFAFGAQYAMTMKINDGKEESFLSMVMKADVIWQVQEMDKDGHALISGKLARIRTDVTTGVNPQKTETVFDSDDKGPPRDENLAKIMMSLVNKGVTWKMDPFGKVNDTKAPEEMIKYYKDQNIVAGESVAYELIHTLFYPMGLTLPADGAAKDKAWAGKVRELKVDNEITITHQPQFTLEGMEKREGREMARIAVKPKMTLDPSEKAKQLGLKMSAEKTSGTVYFDNGAGKIAGGDLAFEFTLEAAGAAPVSMQVQVFVTMTVPKKSK